MAVFLFAGWNIMACVALWKLQRKIAMNPIETFGMIRADGTLELEQKLAAPPGRVKVRVEFLAKPASPADWDAAMQAAAEIEDYDFDAFQKQRDYDLQHAKDHLP